MSEEKLTFYFPKSDPNFRAQKVWGRWGRYITHEVMLNLVTEVRIIRATTDALASEVILSLCHEGRSFVKGSCVLPSTETASTCRPRVYMC